MFKKEKKRKDSGISTEENSVENGGGKNSKRSPERKKRNRMSSGGSVDSRNDTVSSGSAEMSLAVANTSRNCTTSSEASPVRPADLPTAQTSGDQQTRGGQVLSAESIQAILRERLAYLSGGLDNDSHPIVTVPDVGLRSYNAESYEKFCTTLQYFRTLMKPEQVSVGITLLLDARSTKTHNGAKLLIESLISQAPPIPLHIIYILMKTSLFGRPKHLVTADQGGQLHLAYLYDTKSVLEQLDEANVITELDGKLHYDHDIWLHNRLQFEHAVALHSKVMAELPDLLTALDLYDVPKDVKDAEKLMQEDLKLKERIVNEITVAEMAADYFMTELKEQNPEDSLEMSPATKDYITMMSLLKGMLEELKEKEEEFDKLWALHRARVDHMMRMCHFNRSAAKIQRMMQGHIDDLTDSKVIAVGDTLESALELGEKHEAFVTKCKETMDEHMTTIRQNGQELLHPSFSSQENEENMHASTRKTISMVREQIHAVSDTYQSLMTTCQQKRNLFIVCVKFHMSIRQCEQWYQEVLEFLASQPMEEPTQQVAASLLSHIDSFLERMTATEIATMKELASTLPGKHFKKMMQKAETKYEQTRELLEKRKVFLLKIIASAYLPPPTPGQALSSTKSVVSEGSASELDSSSQAQSGDELGENEEEAKMQKGRQFVYQELVATEKDYIRDLECVVNSYYDAMDPNNMSIPLRLRGKRDVVFANLPEIFKFHDNTFRKALEQYADCPERVGECFIQHTEEFQMYSAYCKNRTNSETLMNESTESQAFFKSMQMQLAQALPLNSYLIKPIQRITKYQLLIKDMLKHSVHAQKAHSDLQVALDRMLKVLKNLNDSLHVVGLRGFPGALAEQGRLLIHDPFHVWESSGRARDRFARGKERHTFLYEKVIIFSKKIENPVQHRDRKSDSYIYKNHVEIAELTLREMLENQPLQFEVAMHGQHKTYKFQACSTAIRDMWAQEIRRLLKDQFTLMKDKVIKSGTLNRNTYRGRVKPSTLTRDSRLFGDSFRMREPPSKKSFADRFKILKRRKKSTARAADNSLTTSLPAAAVHALQITTSSLSPELLATQTDKLRTNDSEVSEDSKSSDEEFPVSDNEDDDGLVTTAAVDHYESLAPTAARYYMAISDYNPGESDENGIALTQDQEVEVIGINKYGWWWVRATNYVSNEVEEGWVPASYLNVSPIQTVP